MKTRAKRSAERVQGREHYIQLNVDVPVDLVDAVTVFCQANAVTRKKVVEVALRRFLTLEGVGKGGAG